MRVINPNIQVARAVAVCMVLYIHAVQFMPQFYLKDTLFLSHLTSWVWGGAGVDLFFVISGFVIGMNISSYKSIYDFYKARFIRVAPLYWVMTLLFAAYSYALSVDSLATYKTINFETVVKSLLFIQDFHSGIYQQPVLPVGWTLNYEAFFYLTIGLMYFLWTKYKALVFTIALAALGLIYINIYAEYMFIFLLGVALQILLKNINYRSVLLSLFLFGCSVPFFISSPDPYMAGGILRVLIWGAGCTLLFLSIYFAPIGFCKKWMIIIGDASYSIYLAHWFFRYINLYTFESNFFSIYFAVLINILIMLLMGILVYIFIEAPLMRFLRLVKVNNQEKDKHSTHTT